MLLPMLRHVAHSGNAFGRESEREHIAISMCLYGLAVDVPHIRCMCLFGLQIRLRIMLMLFGEAAQHVAGCSLSMQNALPHV